MNIKSDIPEIARLKEKVEKCIDFPLSTHGDFLRLSAGISFTLREYISESTLERLWEYSTRHYYSVSLRTLNVLSRFIGYHCWDEFCKYLCAESAESQLFEANTVNTKDLPVGAHIKLGWLPDRICIIRYLGDNRFIAEETHNSTMQPGDTFACLQFQKRAPLHLDEFCKANSTEMFRYVVGTNSGLTILEVL